LLNIEMDVSPEVKIAEEKINRGDIDEAIKILEIYLNEHPQDYYAINKLGVAFVYNGKTNSAKECFYKAIEINPNFAPSYSNIGNLFTEEGKYEEALYWYKKALEIDPQFSSARTNLAHLYRVTGRIDMAVEELKRTYHRENGKAGIARNWWLWILVVIAIIYFIYRGI
jgi:Flp pilus assembly protein TadD, contains TPR repeats